MTKTGGVATFTGTVNGAALTINGTGGTLNLGAGLTHTFTGVVTLTNGTLNGGSSTLNENATSTTAWNGTGTNFTAGTGTVVFGGVNQTLATASTFNNLTFAGSGTKTLTGVPTVNGIVSMEGTATVSAAPTYGANATLQYNTATARTAGVEWITPFVATGGIIIANTGAITLNSAEVLGASVPLTINSGATLNTSASNFQLTLGGNFVNNGGTFTANASPIVIANTMVAQSIAGFTTTGLVSMTKTAGTATFTGNVSGAGLTINGTGGTLDLGAGFTHTVTGNLTLSAGTLLGNSSALNVSGNLSVTGTFTPGTGTVTLNGAAAQTISGTSPVTFNTLNVTNAASPNITLTTNVTAATLSGTATLTASCPDFTLTSTTPSQVLHTCTTTVSSINRANASPTSAATVSWTVIFTQSVTGVDGTAFSLVPSVGLSGAFITTVTGAGTTWTVTANTGIGSGTLGLNQTAAGSVSPLLIGTFTGQVYTITSTPALAEYRMDEASWNGTANEVIDSGPGGYNGTAGGLTTRPTTSGTSPAIGGSPGTCRYGVFNRSNKDYIALPSFPNLATAAGDFTITAWINVADNTQPGQRIFIDDENNTSPGGWGFSVGETTTFGIGGLRFYYRQPTVYTLDTTAIPSNQWLFVALSVQLAAGTNASAATIYAWDTTGALVTSNTGTFTWTAGADPGPSSIGGETNASGEGTNQFGFGGTLDEVRVYQKVLSQSALTALRTQTHACPVYVPDHLLIQSSGSGLTCAANTLTVAACKDPSCATPFTLGVSGTLSATGTPTVNWNGTTGGAVGAGFVIPGGSSSVTKDVQVATAGTVVFGITAPAPVPTNATTCNFGSPVCTFTANTAGFIYSDTTTGTSYTIPAQVSGIATPTLYLRALQTSTTNPAVCTPAIISNTVPVNMGYTCNNPATCQAGNLTTINATAVAPGGTSVSLIFDANASAPITARYDDVGNITLNASTTVTPFGTATPVTLTGSSNAYVVTPHHFDLSGIQQTAAPNRPNPAAAIATDPIFVKAGEAFTVTVTARNFLNATTPNYGKETSAESVKLTPSLVAPTGGAIPALGSGTFGAFSGGVATGTNFAWNEVGIITLTPSVGDANYLGAGDVSGTTSGNVGRFYPDHFSLSAGSLANRGGACAPASSFTYLDEGLNLQLTLTAQSSGGGTTQNYDGILAGGGFAKLAPGTFSNYSFGARSGTTNLTSRISGTITGTPAWASGMLSAVTASATVAARNALPLPLRDGPWTGTQFGIAPSDSDGTQLLASALNLDVDNNAVNDHQAVGATTELRFGRLHLLNAYGSELLPILLPVRAEYWNSNNWRVNPNDSCTVLTPGALAIGDVTKPAGSALAFSTPPTGVTGSPSATLTGGVTSLRITPAVNGVGSADVILNLGGSVGLTSCVTLSGPVGGATPTPTLPQLAGSWCGSAYNKAPVARIKFGSPRAPYIYLRERY